jgi:hypothetical protein
VDALELRREGDDIVTPIDTTWPARCVKCNRPVRSADFVMKAQWVPRWVIFLFVISWLIGLIVYLFKRRRFQLTLGLCEEHRASRTQNMFIGGGLVILGVVLMVVSAVEDVGVGAALGGVTLLGGILWTAISANLMMIKKVEGNYAWVRFKGPFFESVR